MAGRLIANKIPLSTIDAELQARSRKLDEYSSITPQGSSTIAEIPTEALAMFRSIAEVFGNGDGIVLKKTDLDLPEEFDPSMIEREELDFGNRKGYCGRWIMHSYSRDARFSECSQWFCGRARCGLCNAYWKRKLALKIYGLIMGGMVKSFVTLTVKPSRADRERGSVSRQVYFKGLLDKFFTYLRRKGYKFPGMRAKVRPFKKVKYLWVNEFHKKRDEKGRLRNPYLHAHILMSEYIPRQDIAEAWKMAGGGDLVGQDVQPVRCTKENAMRSANYMCKYMTKKGTIKNLAKGKRMWSRSNDYKSPMEMFYARMSELRNVGVKTELVPSRTYNPYSGKVENEQDIENCHEYARHLFVLEGVVQAEGTSSDGRDDIIGGTYIDCKNGIDVIYSSPGEDFELNKFEVPF